ncbi:N-acetylglucosamine kinase [Tenacibaculum soleae]|uniref:N-acetylglucosamine kinase n=1 Tax=Tenacibaculum soleae TaxID=447689 RepID=A0A1B9XZV3_9FLAO|nr:N-acetylglucosamine kinase [Tenacibaculum soleae]MDO6811834.1 N-acetylglucosamine kinase [Tenacibaculum soleae]OCK43062.1 N-acetylglucosamine kinase [Tenacibaculum soleae]
MILIADGGSTKVDWIALDKDSKKELFRITSQGLNPVVVKEPELINRLYEITEIYQSRLKITEIYFYGAGCGSEQSVKKLNTVLISVFKKAKITIKEDILAAAYSCAITKPSIICILGTGSNSCYYDGTTITKINPSLGYSIMDEASGNYFGKRLLRDYYYNKMPIKLATQFKKKFNLDIDVVKSNLYNKPNPNMYLATFSKFMLDYQDEYYIKRLIKKGFKKYLKYYVLPYKKNTGTPIYFVGSIAYYFKNILINVAKKNNLFITDIIQRPIDNLVKFHQINKI